MQTNPYAPPQSEVADLPETAIAAAPVFFAVSRTKLFVMSFCTLGLYELYWFYKNWQRVKQRKYENITPLLRAIFPVFFCYSLFHRIRRYRSDLPSNELTAGPLATVWIICSLTWRLPEPYFLLSYIAIFALLPVQKAINDINEEEVPGHDRNSRFSAWNWVAVVVGGLLALMSIFGAFVAPR
jgi:hypothetical protein